MIGLLLAAILVCGDARDIPSNGPPCPQTQWGQLCGCGGTIQWDAPVGGTPATRYQIDRQFLNVWTPVGTTTNLWWKTSEDRPLGFEGFRYVYRVWSVAADGTMSLTPSTPVYLIGNPRVCVDSTTWQKVSCWMSGGPGSP